MGRPTRRADAAIGNTSLDGDVIVMPRPDGALVVKWRELAEDGFLLRATDVKRQPFRSMGFVSVIIVSVLYALGLPLVLL